MKRVLLFVIAAIAFMTAYSQVKLSLLDGSQIKLESYVFHSQDYYMDYSFIKDNGKLKNSYVDMEDVFSISLNGVDSIIYAPYEEGEFSVADMNSIVTAKQLALKEYNPWWAYAAGLAVGCGSMFIPMDPFTRLLIPIVYTAGMGFVKPSRSYIIKKHDYAVADDWFVYGYKNAGRKKVFKNTVIGAVGGIFVAGVIVGTLSLLEND